MTTYQQLQVERSGAVFCVRLRQPRLEEDDLQEMADEISRLIADWDCRLLTLSLRELECLYSTFLGKLLMIRRRLLECGGKLTLCDVAPHVLEVFEVCRLTPLFSFAPDEATAVAALVEAQAV
jgi:anti-anti-sigma factor